MCPRMQSWRVSWYWVNNRALAAIAHFVCPVMAIKIDLPPTKIEPDSTTTTAKPNSGGGEVTSIQHETIFKHLTCKYNSLWSCSAHQTGFH